LCKILQQNLPKEETVENNTDIINQNSIVLDEIEDPDSLADKYKTLLSKLNNRISSIHDYKVDKNTYNEIEIIVKNLIDKLDGKY
jgi:hypothetical protein